MPRKIVDYEVLQQLLLPGVSLKYCPREIQRFLLARSRLSSGFCQSSRVASSASRSSATATSCFSNPLSRRAYTGFQ